MKAEKVYVRRFFGAMAIYIILIIVSESVLPSVETSIWRIPIALLPMIPKIGFGMWAFMQFVRQIDEMQRRIHFEAFAFSLGMTGLITFTLGLLQNAGVPPPDLTWVFPMMVAFWGIGVAIARRRYR